jgi:hypothetical protein
MEGKMQSHQAEVHQLFGQIKGCRGSLQFNPITADQFVLGDDPIEPQELKANMALEARDWFEAQRPPDAPELPLGLRHCIDVRDDAIISENWIACLVSRFGESVAHREYRTEGHPLFEEFARGLMASDMWPDEMHKDPDLLRRYPPKPLPGLEHGVWSQPE